MKKLLMSLALISCGPPLEPQYPGNDCLLIEEGRERLLQCKDGTFLWEVGRFYGKGETKVWVPEHWEKQQ
jgi:hypothetical protein